jgi:hypothetical protein
MRCAYCALRVSASGQGLPRRGCWHHDRCTSDSCRLAATPKPARSGQRRTSCSNRLHHFLPSVSPMVTWPAYRQGRSSRYLHCSPPLRSDPRPGCACRVRTRPIPSGDDVALRAPFLQRPRSEIAEVRLVTALAGWPAGVGRQTGRDRRYPRGAAIERTDTVSREVLVSASPRRVRLGECGTGPSVHQGFPFLRPVNAASCVAPCPPRLLPEGRLTRNRHGLFMA